MFTKEDITKLAKRIEEYLLYYHMAEGTAIYYNNVRDIDRYDDDFTNLHFITEYNKCPLHCFDSVNPQHILSMSFEGAFYKLINGYYLDAAAFNEFNQILEEAGLMYEIGDRWNLTVYPIKDNYEDYEYTDYTKDIKPEPVYIHINSENVCPELMLIMKEWWRASKEVGDIGSCVIGAGLTFKYQDTDYFMSACSPYQGSISWERCIDIPKKMLREIGAENIYYNAGRMD